MDEELAGSHFISIIESTFSSSKVFCFELISFNNVGIKMSVSFLTSSNALPFVVFEIPSEEPSEKF